jgi:hypothetical protein
MQVPFEQLPGEVLHCASGGVLHGICAPAMQAPLWHASFWVQALSSLQLVLSGLAGLEHLPVVGSQVPAT